MDHTEVNTMDRPPAPAADHNRIRPGRWRGGARMATVSELPSRFRERAQFLRSYAPDAEASATIWELAASEIESALLVDGAELLTLQEAAQISGYSADHLGRLVRSGRLPNHGRKHAPRVRRADLPMKPLLRAVAQGRQLGSADRGQVVRSILTLLKE